MYVLVFGIALCWLTVVRLRRAGGRKGRLWDFAGPLLVFLFCWPPMAWLAVYTLERNFPVARFPAAEAQAMVVLSGNIYPATAAVPETLPGFGTYIRTAHAGWLFGHWRQLPIVVSGGATGGPGDLTLAELMRRQLVGQGVPNAMIVLEDHSRTTYENAVNTAAILRNRGITRIVLITEAAHMLRAEWCFRRQGLEVVTAPAAYRTLELRSWAEVLQPSAWAIRNQIEALHEWGGLIVYKLRGWI